MFVSKVKKRKVGSVHVKTPGSSVFFHGKFLINLENILLTRTFVHEKSMK